MVKTYRKSKALRKTILAASIGTLLGVGFSASMTSYAGLNSVLSGMLVAAGGPGVYTSQQGETLSGGYAAVSVPEQQYNIISFAPPSISGGCGGINLFMGSFSFISAKQFEQMLENIGEGLLTYAFYSAISAMCSQCSAILNSLEQAAQAMNSLTKNTCNLNAGVAIDNAMSGLASAATNFGKAVATQTGQWSGMFSADQSQASNPVSSFKTWWSNTINNIDDCSTSTAYTTATSSAPSEPYTVFSCVPGGGNAQGAGGTGSVPAVDFIPGAGNNTWRALRHSQAQTVIGNSSATIGLDSYTTMEMLMSMLGTRIVAPPQNNGAGTVNSSSSSTTDKSTPKVKGTAKPGILTLSQLVNGGPETNFYQCEQGKNPAGGDYSMYKGTYGCLNLGTTTFSAVNYNGIRAYVHGMLLGGTFAFPGQAPAFHNGIAYNIANGIALPAAEQKFVQSAIPPVEAWGEEVAQSAEVPSAADKEAYIKGIYATASPLITADLAVSFGSSILEAADLAYNVNNDKILPPPHYQATLNNIQTQISYYRSKTMDAPQIIHDIQKDIQAISTHGTPLPGI